MKFRPYIADSTDLGLKISNRNFKDFSASIFQGRRQECLVVLGFKTKPPPLAKAPPIDAFPTYDEQPRPSADDYIGDTDYPAEAYF